jgi:hypothetical protein
LFAGELVNPFAFDAMEAADQQSNWLSRA